MVNDQSLEYGGLLDFLSGSDWTHPHKSHRGGTRTDFPFRYWDFGCGGSGCAQLSSNDTEYDEIEEALETTYGAGKCHLHPSVANANHWHCDVP